LKMLGLTKKKDGLAEYAGRVRLAGQMLEVHPGWFKSEGGDDSSALQRAADSCVGPCIIMLTRNLHLSKVRVARWSNA
jgi:hypothetical protein